MEKELGALWRINYRKTKLNVKIPVAMWLSIGQWYWKSEVRLIRNRLGSGMISNLHTAYKHPHDLDPPWRLLTSPASSHSSFPCTIYPSHIKITCNSPNIYIPPSLCKKSSWDFLLSFLHLANSNLSVKISSGVSFSQRPPQS